MRIVTVKDPDAVLSVVEDSIEALNAVVKELYTERYIHLTKFQREALIEVHDWLDQTVEDNFQIYEVKDGYNNR
jgi:hypothetical protein